MIPLISIVGKSGVGKTTLLEKLLPELRSRNLRVAVIKHHAHATPVDNPGKDTWRFRQAGANPVVVSSPIEVARFEQVAQERTLADIAESIRDVDLILTEGFKQETAAKIELSRAELGVDLVARSEDLVAVVTDHPIQTNLPRFGLEDVAGLADFIAERTRSV
jgi:molybdopterin-guanine dinucleotide biosynthesis adapter protein